MACTLRQKMTIHPTRNVNLQEIVSPNGYGATLFVPALARFIVQYNNPQLSPQQIEERAADIHFPFDLLPIYHRIKYWNEEIYGHETMDSIHAQPATRENDGSIIKHARFDTALVNVRPNVVGINATHQNRLQGTRVGQVRVIFSLPKSAIERFFTPSHPPPRHLAYTEWFSKFAMTPERNTGMYKVKRATRDGDRLASIVPISLIQRSVHLLPKWGGSVPRNWSSDNVLEECSVFYLNPFKDAHTYFNLVI
ncbi:hypothetical protein BJ138DRAFT_1108007 [Hygrophoropsis aurantiaca]|uniref:Uncharacterized protein n=1 Tax=Hygrophoropsis aurantiaca TaxID=72124 RepID=A0ACB7ZPE8_9AGAM|nr:hypothetical protein BJ138DRAFT_1108007 [Hygrophoropsis aurantiaca]